MSQDEDKFGLLKRMPYLRKNPRAEIAFSPGGIPYNSAIQVFNRKMQIVIPTHKRPERQLTLKSLSPELQAEVLVITSTQEDARAIRKNYAGMLRDPATQVISIEHYAGKKMVEQINSIAKKRQWILENVGAISIFQLDDDQYFFARAPLKYRELNNGSWTLKEKYKGNEEIKLLGKRYLTDDLLTETFREFQRRMTVKKSPDFYAHTCLSSRMGNNQEEEVWKIGGRAMHSIGQRRDVMLKNNIRFDSILLREDFHVTLSLLRLGYANAVFYDVCCSPAEYGAKGGCFDERTVQLGNAQAVLLSKMHPGLVKVVDKNYDDTPRKEVVISWKKALTEGEAANIKKKKSLF